MKQKRNLSWLRILVYTILAGFGLWWLYIATQLRGGDHNSLHNQIFGATYGVAALVGGLGGLAASRKWGGLKSTLGRALLFFGLGLLLQEFGQLAYSYYTYVSKINIPYPSWGDVGYFGSVLCYIYAAWQLSKTAGIKFSLKNRLPKLVAVVVPLAMLAASYWYFLRGYQFDFSSLNATARVVLDFGYPLGQAIYVALALMTYLLSKRLLGGIMRSKILAIVFALMVQYAADSSFLYAAKYAKAFPGGANDFVYLLAYTVMSLALVPYFISLDGPIEKEEA